MSAVSPRLSDLTDQSSEVTWGLGANHNDTEMWAGDTMVDPILRFIDRAAER
jgi:hypothetical protein